ncbi:hypothetical protein KPL71_017712 [Citrus sinensis]|uniref:Uncharacterized protein n=1 Tax=Citrus sinensis TaxID=2711 RepID=A0ACB8JS20_CITSI|nr:hypothetical protein KPL71_017712 [Citrus sinensis]
MLAGCLMGKVLLSRGVNKEGLKAALHLGNNIFMFKFAEETDKKRVLSGGPWHFDRAIIVLTEPQGIEEVTKQSFSWTSFWVQIRNVPIACMEKDFLQALGGKIGIVEEVETDDNGDCFGEFARIRISVNITQPLERILFLKQEGEPDIPMPVVYERLTDFCFCCGIIGHQYKECENYKSQQKEELPYGNWMKATTVGSQARRYQKREKLSYGGGGKSEEKSESSENHSSSQQQRQKQANPSRVNRSEPIGAEMGQIREHDKRSGRERVQVNQMRREEAEIDDGLVISQLRPNKRKWKRQARSPGEGESKSQIGTQKRPSKETFGQNPKKKMKLTGSSKPKLNKLDHFPLTTGAKMSKELLMLEDIESNIAEVSAEAGSQPRRKP